MFVVLLCIVLYSINRMVAANAVSQYNTELQLMIENGNTCCKKDATNGIVSARAALSLLFESAR